MLIVTPAIRAADRVISEQPIVVERPLLDPAVTLHQGVYYLTGTLGTKKTDGTVDFHNNEGVFLWKSSDRQTWTEVGFVWRFDSFAGAEGFYSLGQYQPARFQTGGAGHAVTAPRLHWLERQNKWVISLAKNRYHVHLLFGGQDPEKAFLPPLMNAAWKGPYRQRYVTYQGAEKARTLIAEGSPENRNVSPLSFLLQGDADLFVEDDGTVYLTWADGWLVPLTPELDGRAAAPVNLLATVPGWPRQACPLQCQREAGASVFKHDGAYYLVFTALTKRDGRAHQDTLVSRAAKLLGPYSPPELLIADGGLARVFRDGKTVRAACLRGGRPSLVELNLQR